MATIILPTNPNDIIKFIDNEYINFHNTYYIHAHIFTFDEPKLISLFISDDIRNYIRDMYIKINETLTILIRCCSLYAVLDKSFKINNITTNVNICDFIYEYILYIYQFYIIYTDIFEYKSQNTPQPLTKKARNTTISSITPISNITSIYNFLENINRTNYNSNNIKDIRSYKKFIIYRFNIDVLKFDPSKEPYEFLSQYMGIKSLIYPVPRPTGTITEDNVLTITDITTILPPQNINDKDIIINYILALKHYLNNKIYINPDIDNFINIPQYIGNCWFISIITGIAYSDMHRKLILSKQPSPNNMFLEFILYIITEISEPKTRYLYNPNGKLTDITLNILYNLKIQPELVLKDIIYNYSINNLDISSKSTFRNDIIKIIDRLKSNGIGEINKDKILINDITDPFGYILLYNILTNICSYRLTNDSNNDADNLIRNIQSLNSNYTYFGIFDNTYYILQHLYNLLNLRNLYININYNNDNIIFNKLKGTDLINNPDVVIIHTSQNATQSNFEQIANQQSIIFQNNYKELIYDGNNYKIDYMLHASDQCMSANNCGHCISSITYYDETYTHDSKNISKMVKYKKQGNPSIKDILNIPCGLLKTNWKDFLFKSLCYAVNKCGVKNMSLLTPQRTAIDISQHNLCYDFTKNITLVYVKDDSRTASMSPAYNLQGGNNKYISLHTKINFIYKNKEYRRTLYTMNNKRYVLLNKEYISISTIKTI